MILRVEHIGLAVKDLQAANKLYESLLGSIPYKDEHVPSEKVRTSFFKIGETKIELLENTGQGGPIGKFIEKRGEGIHHIAFEVDDIHVEMDRLKLAGVHLINERPVSGADNKLVCFIHPGSTHGVLVELCQDIRDPEEIDLSEG
jgi:methylmalonyl-CoA/ethylmalonyl-CoA epimerase